MAKAVSPIVEPTERSTEREMMTKETPIASTM